MESPLEDSVVLGNVKHLAYLAFTPEEIAEVIEIDQEKFRDWISDKSNPIYKAYQEGKNERKIKVRKSLMDLAENGSHPALVKVLDLEEKQEFNESSN